LFVCGSRIISPLSHTATYTTYFGASSTESTLIRVYLSFLFYSLSIIFYS
jgi:hypothetical protein